LGKGEAHERSSAAPKPRFANDELSFRRSGKHHDSITRSEGAEAPVTNADYEPWLGKSERASDQVTPASVAALAATLDQPLELAAGTALPPLWHWQYFLARVPTAELAADGHARRGGFLPPVDLPRRMWAGSRLRIFRPLRIGEQIRRRSTIDKITVKHGRSGAFVLVTVRHEVDGEDGQALLEEQDIAYREAPREQAPVAPPTPAPANPAWSHPLRPTPVLLFRYSALTFNSHRIHYDRPYATEVEGYPGLVLHGPLTATLLVQALQREHPQARVDSLAFRALRPLYDGVTFFLEGKLSADGRQAQLWTRDEQGALTMELSVELAT
jgi:3-methylfumaryl-CoA hydratase